MGGEEREKMRFEDELERSARRSEEPSASRAEARSESAPAARETDSRTARTASDQEAAQERAASTEALQQPDESLSPDSPETLPAAPELTPSAEAALPDSLGADLGQAEEASVEALASELDAAPLAVTADGLPTGSAEVVELASRVPAVQPKPQARSERPGASGSTNTAPGSAPAAANPAELAALPVAPNQAAPASLATQGALAEAPPATDTAAPAVDASFDGLAQDLDGLPAEEPAEALTNALTSEPIEPATDSTNPVPTTRADVTIAGREHTAMTQPPSDRSVDDVARASASASEAPRRDVPTQVELQRAADVLRQLRVHLAGNSQRATLQLMPADLGRIQIRMAMSQGSLTAVVRAESKETLELLERHSPELRASLAANGIQAANIELGLGLQSGEPGGEFDRALDETPAALPRSRESEDSERTETQPTRIRPTRDTDDGVDTYA